MVEHHQRLRRHRGVALHHLHIARKGRLLLLVAYFERSSLYRDRLIAVLRKALHRVGDAQPCALRAALTHDRQYD
jgi:hypothetical protein